MNTEIETPERIAATPAVGLHGVVSVRFGELKYSGCNTHPHRLDLSCAKIRRVNGDPLTNADVWEVLKELSDGKHANDQAER